MLGQALAQQIANEITDVIGHNVLITDESGIVLGSGDESRVGQFHEASVEVVRSRRTMAHSSEDVRDLIGTLPGVTVPLVIDDEVVGTIGLSGSPDEVVQFGLVVKRQTEILMQEAARIGTRMMHERATAELLREICEWHHSGIAKSQLLRRGRTLGHDLTLPRRMVLIQWEDTGPEAGSEHIARRVEDVFGSADDLIAPLELIHEVPLMRVRGIDAAKTREELADARLQAPRQRQRGGVDLLDLHAELAEHDVAVEAEVRVDGAADGELHLLQVEAGLARIVAAGLEVVVG